MPNETSPIPEKYQYPELFAQLRIGPENVVHLMQVCDTIDSRGGDEASDLVGLTVEALLRIQNQDGWFFDGYKVTLQNRTSAIAAGLDRAHLEDVLTRAVGDGVELRFNPFSKEVEILK